jgi:hypothetical protein
VGNIEGGGYQRHLGNRITPLINPIPSRKRVDSSAVSTELPTMDETAKANIGIMKIAHVGGRQYFTEIYILDKVLSLDDNEYYVVYPDELNAPKKMNISKKALKFVGDIPEDIKKKIDVPDWVFGKSSIH